MKMKNILLLISILPGILVACTEAKFKIKGDISGAGGQSLVLAKSDFHGQWIAIDSTKVGSNGSFSILSDSPASPEIYRLSLGNRFVYLPIDSVETLTLTTTADKFGHEYTLSGTQQAELLASFEKELMALGTPDSAALADFKRNVYSKYIKEGQGSILSYYVLTKIYDGKPLYNAEDPQDLKYYTAVATQFDNYRPGDPHGRMVKEVSLAGLRNRNNIQGKKNVIEASELRVIDIALQNTKGETVKLSDIVGKGKPVAVVFSMMNEPESPAFNRELARLYNSRGGSFEIYQISFDKGQYEWREAASNLPWINVLDPNGTTSTALLDYNVGALPAVFLYNAQGDLVDRPENLQALEKNL